MGRIKYNLLMPAPKRIALFGGSLNPPHWGHRQVMEYLKGLAQFDEVWILPSFDHPFEKNLIPFSNRKAMCALTVKGLSGDIKVCPIERELNKKPSYTIDIIRALKHKHPGHEFTVVLGSDCKKDLPRWHALDELKKEASFFFIPRAGFENSPFMDISSSRIRGLIKQGKEYTKYLVPEVARYIEEHGLYRDDETPSH